MLIWLNTFAMAVPLHRRLSHSPAAPLVRRLVRANALRALAWTAKAVLLLCALVSSTPPPAA